MAQDYESRGKKKVIKLGRLIIAWRREFSFKAKVAYIGYLFLPVIVIWIAKKWKG